jgi:hypothetical protein
LYAFLYKLLCGHFTVWALLRYQLQLLTVILLLRVGYVAFVSEEVAAFIVSVEVSVNLCRQVVTQTPYG